jgi:hypothetical protein
MVADAKKSPNREVERYINMISAYDTEFKKWETRTKRLTKRFRAEELVTKSDNTGARFNILWSNVQTLIPACFARLPQPSVGRRYKDNDPVGRVAALLLERALEYEVQHYSNYKSAMTNCVQDRFLGGRAQAWVRYEPHIEPMDSPATDDGFQITEDVENEGAEQAPTEYLDIECTPVDYVAWNDFGHEVARTWEEVTCVWRRAYMGREALVERFGEEIGDKIPLDTKPPEIKKMDGNECHQAVVYEIWDKSQNKAVWLSKSMHEIIDTRTPGEKDKLPKLEGFWPCPKPLYATITTDSLVPIPDFVYYQDQANTLDILAQRIDELIKALRVRGVYDSGTQELARLFTEGANNNLIPVKNWGAFAEKNGLKGAIDLVDILPFAQALDHCYKAAEQVKQQIYEITHIADILRGVTDPNETLGAQQMKGQFASMPLRDMQKSVEEFAQELIQIKAQIICSQYSDETIFKISGASQLSPEDQQLIPQALALLRDKPMRGFRIEVAADSMVQMDEQRERQERTELLAAVGGFLREALPIAQGAPMLVPMLMELLKFAVAAFKAGKTMEGIIDQAADQLKQAASQPKPPPPDPALEKAKLDAQVKMQQQQADMQMEQQKQAIEMQFREREMQFQAALEQQKLQAEQQNEAIRQKHEADLELLRANNDIQIADMEARTKAQLDVILAHINAQSKSEVAHIGAAAQAKAAERAETETTE